MILGQDMLHVIRPLEYYETDRKDTPIAIWLPVDWVLSGPLPPSWALFSTCVNTDTQIESDFNLANQTCRWYDSESFGAYKQVEHHSISDARGQKILEEKTSRQMPMSGRFMMGQQSKQFAD